MNRMRGRKGGGVRAPESGVGVLGRERDHVSRRSHGGFTVVGFNHLALPVLDTKAAEARHVDGFARFERLANRASKRVDDVFCRRASHESGASMGTQCVWGRNRWVARQNDAAPCIVRGIPGTRYIKPQQEVGRLETTTLVPRRSLP